MTVSAGQDENERYVVLLEYERRFDNSLSSRRMTGSPGVEQKSVETVVAEIYGQRSTDSTVRVCHYVMCRNMRALVLTSNRFWGVWGTMRCTQTMCIGDDAIR